MSLRLSILPVTLTVRGMMSVIKILIVDDNEMDRVLASHLLSDLFDFVYATDGVEGLTMCDSVMPDLVITDMLMPNMGGMEMLTELQKRYPRDTRHHDDGRRE